LEDNSFINQQTAELEKFKAAVDGIRAVIGIKVEEEG